MKPRFPPAEQLIRRNLVCCSKRRFGLEVKAMTKAISIMNHPNHKRRCRQPLYTYHCPACDGWHLTRTPQKKTS